MRLVVALASGLVAATPGAARADGAAVSHALPSERHRTAWQQEALESSELQVGDEADAGSRAVTLLIDRARLAKAVPLLRDNGALPASFTEEEAERRPALATNVLSLLLASWAVRDAYTSDPALGPTRWTVVLRPEAADEAAREIFSFAMDRPRFRRIAWDGVTPGSFRQQVGAFSYNLRFSLDVSREVMGGIDED